MITNKNVTSGKCQVTREGGAVNPVTCHPSRVTCKAFTLVEILVVVVLLSFIILALMTVFNATQTAFRASITQTDVMEGGRSVMGLLKSDFESMTPSYGESNIDLSGIILHSRQRPVNFYVNTNSWQYQSNPRRWCRRWWAAAARYAPTCWKNFSCSRARTRPGRGWGM